jgi:diguanylate cyclase (GGDEF)-like protein/PAS domain S-box-containing protein
VQTYGDLAAFALLVSAASGAVFYLAHRMLRAGGQDLAALRASEERFRGLTELSADWFWETDSEHRVTWLSGGLPVATLFGHTPTFGKRFWEIPRVEIDPLALEAHLARIAAREPFFDLEISRADERGARQIHVVSGQSRQTPDGRFLGYRGVGRDVTEQRRAARALAEAKERIESALDGGNLAEWDCDVASDEIYLGPGWARLLGGERSASIGRSAALLELVHPEDRERTRAAFLAAIRGETPSYSAEYRVRVEGGGWKWLHSTGRVTARGADGRALRVSGTVADIDQSKRAELALAEREQRFRDVVEASGEYVWETDADWRYIYLSERVEAVFGYSRAEMLGRTPREFMPLGEERAVEAWFSSHASARRAFRDLEHRSLTKSGGVIWQSVSGVPVRDAGGGFLGYRGTAADITARRQAEQRIEYLATRDALTGLPNRTLLADRAGQAILAAARGRSQLALLVVDLDRFKLVNDSLGYQAGDALLRAVGERLRHALRREDTLARLGGDEFVLLWEGLKSAADAAAVAQRVQAILARPFTVEGRSLNAGASIGVAVYPGDGADFAELLKNADAAMHHAKESARGTYRFFSPALMARATERLRLENELRAALTRGELALHWQPVVRGRPGRGRVVGAEALVRWRHPERGLLLPEDFVPLAEECGLIRAVGEWTLERALSQAGAWQRALPADIWVSLNVSAPELAQGAGYAERLRAALEANGLEGPRLELEVTERVLMTGLAENLEALKRIGELGVRFAIDDFGTGYSSLAYLRLLPIDKLKIDRSFLRELDTHPADEAIVRAIAAMAGTLGISVAAEGVESDAQLARLLELGCEEWQGNLFSAPLEAAQFEQLLVAEERRRREGTTRRA